LSSYAIFSVSGRQFKPTADGRKEKRLSTVLVYIEDFGGKYQYFGDVEIPLFCTVYFVRWQRSIITGRVYIVVKQ